MVSVIIPSLLKSEYTGELLRGLNDCKMVKEIIFINNSLVESPLFKNLAKLKVITPNQNLYVNASWNLGVRHSECDFIALCNDDINFEYEKIETILACLNKKNGIIGISEKCINSDPDHKITFEIAEYRNYGYGALMFLHKSNYTPIPDELKIWCGDDYLFYRQRGFNYKICGIKLITTMSTTSGLTQFDDIKQRDMEVYSKYYRKTFAAPKRIYFAVRKALIKVYTPCQSKTE